MENLNKDVWLVGNKGMLGSDVETLLKEKGYNVWGTDKEVDITDLKSLYEANKDKSFDWIINCAAYTDVDKAEIEQDKAFRINVIGSRNVAIISEEMKAKLIYISTDYVFDGNLKLYQSYKEDDEKNPLSIYGLTKSISEDVIKYQTDNYYILRTSWLFGKNGKNFVKTMLKLFQSQETVNVVCDQVGSPTYTKDLAFFIEAIIEQETGKDNFGTYHITNSFSCSWYDFARQIYYAGKNIGLITKEVQINPISSEIYKAIAKRPKNSRLDTSFFQQEYGIKPRSWINALDAYLDEIKQEGK